MPNICKKCGTTLNEGTQFCPMCGAAVSDGMPVQPLAGQNARYEPPAPPMPMKWFKFIIYFQLFFSALTLVITAIQQLTGMAYGDGMATFVYMLYPALHGVDFVVGVLELLLAAACIYVRQLLAKFRAKGPRSYLILMGASIVISLIYVIIASLIIGQSVFSPLLLGNWVGSAVMIAVNWIYFGKREHLFVN